MPEPLEIPYRGMSPSLMMRLRAGSLSVYFRACATEPGVEPHGVDPTDCSRQRTLSEAGRSQAQAIGSSITRLAIPIGEVWSSEFCRARDTARLAFGRAKPTAYLNDLRHSDDPERSTRASELRSALGTPPRDGSVRLLVSHGANLEAATGLSIAPGVALVFAATADAGTRVLALLEPDDWNLRR